MPYSVNAERLETDPALAGFLSAERLIRPRVADVSSNGRTHSTDSQAVQIGLWTLGTGTPKMEPNRSGPATLLRFDTDYVLIDCGSGSAHRLAEARVDPSRLSAIFITHHHIDHNSDLAHLLIAPWVCDQSAYRAPLIVGPSGTREMVSRVFALHEYDIRVRLPHGFDIDRLVPAVVEVRDGQTFGTESWGVKAFRVDHAPVGQAYGYRFTAQGFSAAISGDTRPSRNLVAACQNVDVLIHEVIYPGYGIPEYHTLSHEVGVVARHCAAKRLVLTHLLPGHIPEDRWLHDAKLGYAGSVDVGYDLMKVV